MSDVYEHLASGALGISKTNFNALPTQGSMKKATGIENGTQLEVFDASSGTVSDYAECFQELWYTR